MGLGIPPLKLDIMPESNPLKSRVLVRRLAVLPSGLPRPPPQAVIGVSGFGIQQMGSGSSYWPIPKPSHSRAQIRFRRFDGDSLVVSERILAPLRPSEPPPPRPASPPAPPDPRRGEPGGAQKGVGEGRLGSALTGLPWHYRGY